MKIRFDRILSVGKIPLAIATTVLGTITVVSANWTYTHSHKNQIPVPIQTNVALVSPTPTTTVSVPPTIQTPSTPAPTETPPSLAPVKSPLPTPKKSTTKSQTHNPAPIQTTPSTANSTPISTATPNPVTVENTPQSTPTQQAQTSNLQNELSLENQMLTLLNNERSKAGLDPLIMDETLRNVARNHSRDMWIRNFFSHTNPDGLDPFARMKNAGISYMAAGENIAEAPTMQIAHTNLMNSPEHRDNILRTTFKHIGIGIVSNGSKGVMITQDFRD